MNLDDLDKTYKSGSIISLFSTYVYLKQFFSQETIETLHRIELTRKLNPDSGKDILSGFKLAIVKALDSYITGFVDAPDLLGVEPDYDYFDYTHYTKGRGRSISQGATRSGHTISRFVDKANKLLFKIIGINNWEFINLYKNEFYTFADALKNIFLNCYSAEEPNDNQIDIETAIKFDSSNHMLSEFTNVQSLLYLYTNYYYDFRPSIIPNYDDVFSHSDYQTRFESIYLMSHSLPKKIPNSWAVGYTTTVHETLKSITTDKQKLAALIDLDSKVHDITNWSEFEKYSFDLHQLIGPLACFGYYAYSNKLKPSTDMLQDLLGEHKKRSSPERILSIVGNRARMVDSGNSGAAHLNFICLLDGAIAQSKRTKEKVRLAIFTHKLSDEQECYSIGLFMPAYGQYGFSNASTWWIFHYVGNNHSGTSFKQWRQVWEKIKRNEDHIEKIFINADEDEFLKYCEDPGYVRLDTEIKCIDQIVGKLRGTYPELLIAYMLANKGFHPVKLRTKPTLLNKYKDDNINGELDIIGFKIQDDTCEIVIYESKGQARTDRELDDELKKFSNTIQILANNYNELCEEFGISFNGNFSITAYFVSMASLTDIKEDTVNNHSNMPRFFQRSIAPNIPDNITFWDYNVFLDELKTIEVPDIYLDLLKQMPIATTLEIFDTDV